MTCESLGDGASEQVLSSVILSFILFVSLDLVTVSISKAASLSNIIETLEKVSLAEHLNTQ